MKKSLDIRILVGVAISKEALDLFVSTLSVPDEDVTKAS